MLSFYRVTYINFGGTMYFWFAVILRTLCNDATAVHHLIRMFFQLQDSISSTTLQNGQQFSAAHFCLFLFLFLFLRFLLGEPWAFCPCCCFCESLEPCGAAVCFEDPLSPLFCLFCYWAYEACLSCALDELPPLPWLCCCCVGYFPGVDFPPCFSAPFARFEDAAFFKRSARFASPSPSLSSSSSSSSLSSSSEAGAAFFALDGSLVNFF